MFPFLLRLRAERWQGSDSLPAGMLAERTSQLGLSCRQAITALANRVDDMKPGVPGWKTFLRE